LRSAGIVASSKNNTSGVSDYRSLVLADNPYCYYPLDDVTTPVDVMGNTTPDQVLNVTLGAPGIGDGATAATFTGGGTNQGIRIPSAELPAINTITSITVEILAKADNMTAIRAIFARDNMILLRHNSSASLEAYTGSGWANQIGGAQAESTPSAIHHYAITWDGSLARLFRDGSVIVSESQTGAMSSSTQSLYIGARSVTNNAFLGTLAGFAFYTTELPPATILAHAQAAGVA
jgi:hypothetical protein